MQNWEACWQLRWTSPNCLHCIQQEDRRYMLSLPTSLLLSQVPEGWGYSEFILSFSFYKISFSWAAFQLSAQRTECQGFCERQLVSWWLCPWSTSRGHGTALLHSRAWGRCGCPGESGQLKVKFLIYFSAGVQEPGCSTSAFNSPIHLHLESCAVEQMENIQLKDLPVGLASPPSESHVDQWLQSIMLIPSPGIIGWLSAVAPIVIANAYSSELFLLALSHRLVLKYKDISAQLHAK